MKKWESIYSEADRELLKKIGMGKKLPFGKKPAFLIVDVAKAFVGSAPKPVMESTNEYSTSCGDWGWEAMSHIKRLQDTCRAKKVPVIYTTNDCYTVPFTGGATKSDKPSQDPLGAEIAETIKPLPDELIIHKTRASGFFQTPLMAALVKMKVDCLLVCGTSTSGCVRATLVDAWSNGFPCYLVEECTFDRFELSHLVNLWDINAKYGDVIGIDEAADLVDKL